MPLLDMPLEQLRTYKGRNPKPADFDSFWDKSIKKMQKLDPDVKLVSHPCPAPFAECFHLYFTGVGGSRIHAKYIRPKKASGKHPAVLMFHGYEGSSGDWFDKLNYVAMGFAVAALDCRGQGGLSEDLGSIKGSTMKGHIIRGLDEESPEKLLFHQIFLDTAQLARIVMDFPEIDAARIGATGGSQGGALTIACASLEPRIKLAAPVFPFLCDYKRVWEMDLAKGAYAELCYYFRLFDPLHKRENEIFERLGYIDLQHLAPRIEAEILMGVGLMDNICPPSTQFAAYNKIGSKKDLLIYPDFGHEGLPGITDAIYGFMSRL